MKLVSKSYSMAALTLLSLTAQDDLCSSFVKGKLSLKEKQGEQKEGAKVIGKLLCILEIRLNKAKAAMVVAQNVSLAEYFKKLYGEAIQTHCLSLKNAYAAFVMTGRNTEEDYDNNSGNCLGLASSVVTAVNGDLEHAAVKAVAVQLHERSDKEAANLREILLSVKPAAKLTPEEAVELIQRIYEDGQLAIVVAAIPETVSNAPDSYLSEIYQAITGMMEKIDETHAVQLDAFAAAKAKANAPMELITPETLAAAAAAAAAAPAAPAEITSLEAALAEATAEAAAAEVPAELAA